MKTLNDVWTSSSNAISWRVFLKRQTYTWEVNDGGLDKTWDKFQLFNQGTMTLGKLFNYFKPNFLKYNMEGIIIFILSRDSNEIIYASI